MSHVLASSVLSDEGVMTLLTAAIAAATEMGQPQCIVIVDQSGVTLGSFCMRGSRFQALKSAAAKAQTAASIGAPSHSLPEHARVPLAVATHGGMTGLRGGLPIRVSGTLVGGIGVGSGSGEQDEQVARAALKEIGADLD
ncbi:heme-binding protein [Rhizobium tropici]|uniref:Heme-binding protein n=1 Tax=Rhizobium tropici TaxID=398 RepID=A0A5B0VRM2_RHITR|nr:heme-binding protein [Rhizobium tropici]KAA1177350.1 heme-binding protein [Rhizobium tropici]